MDGDYSGGRTTLGQLKSLGDFGLGTFSDFRGGEMLIFEGLVYSISHPRAVALAEDPELRIPFAMTTRFQAPDAGEELTAETYADLQNILNRRFDPEKNYAVSVAGNFRSLEVQCVQPPGRPGLPFAQLKQQKAVLETVAAQLVGFRMGLGAEPNNHPGYHFHVLTRRAEGGHLLGFESLGPVTVRWQEMKEWRLLHP